MADLLRFIDDINPIGADEPAGNRAVHLCSALGLTKRVRDAAAAAR